MTPAELQALRAEADRLGVTVERHGDDLYVASDEGDPAQAACADQLLAAKPALLAVLPDLGPRAASADGRGRAGAAPAEQSARAPDGDSGDTWPGPIAPEAFYGLAGDVVHAIEPTTEADPVALLVSFLTYFGNCAGAGEALGPRFVVEDTDHGCNEFVGLVGATSKARKGTADKRIRRLFRLVAEEWTTSRVQSGLSSGEGLIWAVRDPITRTEPKAGVVSVEDEGEADKRLLIVENELATVLRRIEREGSSLSPLLRDAWDRHPLDTMVSERHKARARAATNHVSVIGHITKSELERYLTRTEAANGLGNRFVWACVKRARILPRGGPPPHLSPLVKRLHEALAFAGQLTAPVDFDPEALECWEAVYEPLSEGKPGLLGAMIARGEAHVVRLALISAVLDQSPVIRAPHLFAALAVWDFAEASARHIFQGSLGDPDADAVLEALRANPDGLTQDRLRDYFQRHYPADRLRQALASLREQGLVAAQMARTGGRPATQYRAVDPRALGGGASYLAMAKGVYLRGKRGMRGKSPGEYESGPFGGSGDLHGKSPLDPVSPQPREKGAPEGSDISAQIPRTYRAASEARNEIEMGLTAHTALTAHEAAKSEGGAAATPTALTSSADEVSILRAIADADVRSPEDAAQLRTWVEARLTGWTAAAAARVRSTASDRCGEAPAASPVAGAGDQVLDGRAEGPA